LEVKLKIAIPKESTAGETRVTMIPPNIEQLVKLGAEIEIESGLGDNIGVKDEAYESVGAKIINDKKSLLSNADIVLKIRKPAREEINNLKRGCIHISYLDPFNEKDLIASLASAGISAVSMEMIPRTTLAQKMDVLSSQANLAGYISVIIAAERSDKILPMMMTPAGTISPARIFIIGAGVAGLQAIATAKRLGARVEAFDTREVVEEQVLSLGAKFVKVDLGETGQTKDGYAKALTDEQLQKQRDAMTKHCAQADIVITTAQVFGKKAPLIVTKDLVSQMKSGSIIVDMAVESGGNVEGSVKGQEVDVNGVKILGIENLPGRVAVHASQMYSANVYNFINEFWDKENKKFNLNLEHEIIKGCLITHNGEIVNETIKNLK
jgi:NAD(P) transhydrogenase subunit alpha